MQQFLFAAGDTSQTIDVFLPDSSSTTGGGRTGLVFNTASLTAYYRKGATGTSTAITLATQTVGGAYSSGGFVETDATNQPGMYRFDIPDTVLAAAGKAMLYFRGASNLAPTPVQIQIDAPVALDMAQALPTAPVANSVGEALFIVDNLAGRINTAQAGAASTITLDAGASSVDGRYVGYMIYLYGGTGGGVRGVGQERTITAYVGSTKVATVAQAWGTNPDSASKFILYPQPFANVGIWNGTVLPASATAGIPDVNTKNINNVAAATPGASGGILISGSNAGTTTFGALTVTGATTHTGNVSMAAGLNITQSTSNASALVVTGNGTGHGAIFTSGSGATGNGVQITSAATNGSGLSLTSTGTGSGLFTDKLTASGAVAFQSTFAVTTSTSLGAISGSTLTLSGAVAFQSTWVVMGTTTLTGVVTASNGSNNIVLGTTVVTDMTQTNRAEPGQGAPAATTTPAAKIDYLYKAWRNKKTQTATVYSLFDDAGTTVDQKAAISDDGTTTTVGEVATGP